MRHCLNKYRSSAAGLFIVLFILVFGGGGFTSCTNPVDDQLSETSDITSNDSSSNTSNPEALSCSAGSDQDAGLGTVSLTGSVSNAGDDVTYSWRASDSNPSTVSLADSTSSSASFDVSCDLDEGEYEFILTVSDGTATANDSVIVSVNYVDKMIAYDGATKDYYSLSISLSPDGTTALIGAPYDNDMGTYSGSAYIYTCNDSGWSLAAKVTATDGEAYDYFGRSVSLSSDGSTALIGAPGRTDINSDDDSASSGSAYIFTRSGSGWSQAAELTAEDGAASDCFGRAVSLSSDGSSALIGASKDDDNGATSGSAYIFSGSGSSWSQEKN